jgi:hypothetical protein
VNYLGKGTGKGEGGVPIERTMPHSRVPTGLVHCAYVGTQAIGTKQDGAFEGTRVYPLDQASDQGQVAESTGLTGKPQAGADHQRQRHPDSVPLFLDPDLVGLHLPEVARLLDQVLLHRLILDPRLSQPTRHRPFVEPKGNDDCLQRTAVSHERDHERHGLG